MRTRRARHCRSSALPLLLLLSALGESEWAAAGRPGESALASAGRPGTGCRSRNSPTRLLAAPRRGGAPSGRARGRAAAESRATRALRAGDGLARCGLSARPGARGRGRRQRTARRAAHRSGTLCPGDGADTASASDLRAVPLRAAQLRGDRLSPGIDAPVGGATEPVRLVVADRVPRSSSSSPASRSFSGWIGA